jgi:hypothetical protein
VSTSPPSRSVKIGNDERTGWSSERPRRDGAPPRLADISTRNRVLNPDFRLRYSPGSLVVIVGAASAGAAGWAERIFEERAAVLSSAKVRALLAGKLPDEQIAERTPQLLLAAATKRLEAKQSVALVLDGFDAEERDRYLRLAHGLRRPRHAILIEGARDEVTDEERPALDAFRKALDDGELGAEGFQTSLRLGGRALQELKRIVFQPPPAED